MQPQRSHSEDDIHGNSASYQKLQKYLGEFVYGGIDGSVTTFAVVAGSAGADLSASVVIILGLANLIADGFSMSVGAYLSAKSERDNYEKHRNLELWEVENLRESEIEEVREIYQQKGFEGELLEQVVDKITEDKDRWVDVMMKEELEMSKESKSPFLMGVVTLISFVVVGFIPILVYVLNYIFTAQVNNTFKIACLLTSMAFIGIGWMKSYVTQTNRLRGILETLLLGAFAAILAYFVGDVLEKLIT